MDDNNKPLKPFIKVRASDYKKLCSKLSLQQIIDLPFYFLPEDIDSKEKL